MYIRGLQIDGFGIFHDASADNLPPGLSVFVGSNESGKSTLMEYFRYVLFGPPPGHKRNKYPPLRGGRHGGRLLVALGDGRELTIERTDKQVSVYETDGQVEKVEPATRLFGGIERGTFERVFAVGLEDLKGTQVIHEQGVSSRLFAAGTGLGERSLPTALKRLDGEIDSLLKRRGRTQAIVQLNNQLQEVAQAITHLGQQAGQYVTAQQERVDLQQQVEQLRTRGEEIRQRLDRIEQLQDAREHWVLLGKHQDQVAQLADAPSFPPSGLTRFESLQREIEELVALVENKQDQLKSNEDQLQAITVDESLLEVHAKIEHLTGERSALAAALHDRPGLTADCERLQDECGQRLRDLGPDWSPDRLATADTSVQVRQEVHRVADEMQEVRTALTAARAHVESRQADLERARDEAAAIVKRTEQVPEPAEPRAEVIAKRREAVARMRPLLSERMLQTSRLEDKQAAREEAQRQLANVDKQLAAPRTVLPLWLVLTVAVLGAVLAAAVLFESLVASIGTLLVTAALVVVLLLVRRKQQAGESDRLGQLPAERERLAEKYRSLDELIATLTEQIASVSAQLGQLAQDAGSQLPGDLAGVEQLDAQVSTQQDELSRWQAVEQERKAAEDEAQSATAAVAQAEAKQKQLQEQLDLKTQAWQQWLADRGFATTTPADQFALVLEAVETARSALHRHEETQQRLVQVEEYVAGVERQLAEIQSQCGRPREEQTPTVAEIDGLSGNLARAIEQDQQRRQLTDMQKEFQAELGRLERQLAKKSQTLDQLMQAAGAKDEDEFRRAADACRQWHEAKAAADGEELTLRTIAGSQAVWPELEAELRTTTPIELSEERNRLAAELDQLQNQMANDQRAIGSLDEQMRSMAHDERLGEKRLHQETLRQQRAEAVRRWSVRVICRKLLDQAQEVYEKERQPQVIRQAAEYLDTMTNSRYRLVRSLGEDGVQLEDAGLGRKEETVWSSGLADQAYLAIRLGLAREFGRHAEPLPVILDDVLVRFDHDRREAAARVLLEFAAQQQVLLFSCRSDLAELVAEVHQEDPASDVTLVHFDVDDGAIRRREKGR